MKITIVCTLYPPHVLGGAEISTSLLAEGLAARGHEVSVITTGLEEEETMMNGVRVYRLKNSNVYWRFPQRNKPLVKTLLWHVIDIYNIAYKKRLRGLLRKIKPDIVHTNNLCGLSCVVWEIARDLCVPIAHTLRDYYLLCPQQAMQKGSEPCKTQCNVCKCFSVVRKRMSRKVDAVVGISDYILQEHLNHGYFTNAALRRVIPNSVKPSGVKRKEEVLPRNSRNTIGYIGRLSPEKGIELMIEAFIKARVHDSKLLIAGSGNKKYMDQLHERYERDDVSFLGKRDADDFLSKVDLLVVPSLWKEPFGRVVIEAYNNHVPVLLANNGGLPELAEEGISRVFDTESVNPLASLLGAYLKGELSFDESRFDDAVRKYTEEAVVGSYLKLYLDLKSSFTF